MERWWRGDGRPHPLTWALLSLSSWMFIVARTGKPLVTAWDRASLVGLAAAMAFSAVRAVRDAVSRDRRLRD
jgi:hypothetical protein